jgi:hypothetical protein
MLRPDILSTESVRHVEEKTSIDRQRRVDVSAKVLRQPLHLTADAACVRALIRYEWHAPDIDVLIDGGEREPK